MMNVVDLAEDPHSIFEKEVANFSQLELENPVWFCLGNRESAVEPHAGKVTASKSALKSVTAYLFDAFSEGIKQNFLGSDIHMEFLMLSIYVYLNQIVIFVVSSPKQLATDKYSDKRNGTSNILKNDIPGIPLKFILQ
jgi:hypothetical protein